MEPGTRNAADLMRSVLIGAMLVILAGCASAPPPDVIRFGILATTDQLPAWVMQAEGIAARHGLVLEESPPYAGGLALLEAMAADEIDAGYPGIVPAMALAARGQIPSDVRIVGLTNLATPAARSAALVVREDVATWSDLAGRRVGIHSTTSINAASFTARAAVEGLTDYEFVTIGFVDMGLAVRDGTVAAAVMEEPWTTQSVLRGDGRILAFTQGEPPLESMLLSVIAVRAEVAADDALLRRFLRAHLEAVQFIADEPRRARDLMASKLAIGAEVAQQLRLKAFPLDARLDMGDVQALQELLAASGVEVPLVDPLTFYSPGALEAVLSEGT
ncbi:MAG TPA: ABC transporter substrate-binding protein [Candidatus Limnocylindrales bacterium]|nr:ABC transporter substrate-binding protein [Candidatus Limnocylindrales bacterium]